MGLVKFALQQVMIATVARVSQSAGDEIGKAVVKKGSEKIAEQVVNGQNGQVTIPTNINGVLDIVKKRAKTVMTSHGEVEVPEQQNKAPDITDYQKPPADITGQATTPNKIDQLTGTAEEFGGKARKHIGTAKEEGTKALGKFLANARKVGQAAAKGYNGQK